MPMRFEFYSRASERFRVGMPVVPDGSIDYGHEFRDRIPPHWRTCRRSRHRIPYSTAVCRQAGRKLGSVSELHDFSLHPAAWKRRQDQLEQGSCAEPQRAGCVRRTRIFVLGRGVKQRRIFDPVGTCKKGQASEASADESFAVWQKCTWTAAR